MTAVKNDVASSCLDAFTLCVSTQRVLLNHIDVLKASLIKVIPRHGDIAEECQLLEIIEHLDDAIASVNDLAPLDFMPASNGYDSTVMGFEPAQQQQRLLALENAAKAFEERCS
tara:strand:- start:8622 stop:8963 length:342 start_codon:yes stop_codon:yes gene_type:complete